VKVSFDRPYHGDGTGINWGQTFFTWEFPFVRWMEKSGYDVTYATDIDTHTNGGMLLNYLGILSVGHDEYWSKPIYDASSPHAMQASILASSAATDPSGRFGSSLRVSGSLTAWSFVTKMRPLTNNGPYLETVEWRDPPLNRPEQTLRESSTLTNALDSSDRGLLSLRGLPTAGTGCMPGLGSRMVIAYQE